MRVIYPWLVVLASASLVVTAASPGLRLAPAVHMVQAPESLTLELWVECGAHADSAAATVTFNPNYLQVDSVVADESAFSTVMRSQYDNVAGTVRYDAGSLTCHGEGDCPSGAIRMATLHFRALARTWPTTYVDIHGRVVWSGSAIFDAEGQGSTITITSSTYLRYLPLAVKSQPAQGRWPLPDQPGAVYMLSELGVATRRLIAVSFTAAEEAGP